MRELLTPKPFRGDVIAAGVVVLATLVVLLDLRWQDEGAWGRVAYSAAAWALVTAMAALAPMERPAPRAYQSVLYIASLALALVTLQSLADGLGTSLATARTDTWLLALVAVLAGAFATRRNSAACTLAAAVLGGAAIIAAVAWLASPDGATTYRWVLLVLMLGFLLGAVGLRDRNDRHGVAMADAAGLCAVGLVLFLSAWGFLLEGMDLHVSWGWEFVELAAGFGLIAYSAVDREPGPAYLGVLALVVFAVLAAGDDGLAGWPLLLAVIAAALLAVGLRPTTPLPPAPDADVSPAPTLPLP
jgi:hypothetical protein